MQDLYEFEAVIQKVHDLNATYVIFPYDIREEFGKGRIKVHATFDGCPYDGSIVNMGLKHPDGRICYVIGLTQALRRQMQKQAGDLISVTIKVRESL